MRRASFVARRILVYSNYVLGLNQRSVLALC